MQHAAIPGFRLSRAKFSTRVLTSLGLTTVSMGLLSAGALTLTRTGVTPEAVRAYYRGTEAVGLDAMLSASTGRTFQELAEITHLHLSGGGILLFLLCHLLSLCDLPDRLRVGLYVAVFAAFIATFGLPWLIVYASGTFALFFGPAAIALILLVLVCSALPLWEMWGKRSNG